MAIQTVQIDLISGKGIWRPALDEHEASVRTLLKALHTDANRKLGKFAYRFLKSGADRLNQLLGGHYRAEIDELATLANVAAADVLLANIAYDLANSGCSTFVKYSSLLKTTIHARNLDWEFRRGLLKEHLIVTRTTTKQGPYLSVTWPGMFGVLTGVAKGRFAITVNYVKHAGESTPLKLAGRAIAGYWPVTWLVRKVLDEAKDYPTALRRLQATPILAPVLFTISGPGANEGAVVERSSDGRGTRRMGDGAVSVTNHYFSRNLEGEDDDEDKDDSKERFDDLARRLNETPPNTKEEALDLLSKEPLMNADTQYQAVMSSRDGSMLVRIPGGRVCSFNTE